MQIEKTSDKNHEIKIKSRENFYANCVSKIEYASPEIIVLETSMGRLSVKGEKMFVDSLNSETGELLLKGDIKAVMYHEKESNEKWIKRIFK